MYSCKLIETVYLEEKVPNKTLSTEYNLNFEGEKVDLECVITKKILDDLLVWLAQHSSLAS
jgi:hypothetical protein